MTLLLGVYTKIVKIHHRLKHHLKSSSAYFLPHPKTHAKTPLLSWHFLVIYILLFAILRVSFDLVSLFKPGILGVSSNITVQRIIEETNQERQKAGLSVLIENAALNQAATLKAQNMFEENYWAHFSPSGKDPWKFISSSGYKFLYAGENLARNFQTSENVVRAWMGSASHRENILSPKYEEIGIAVVEGVLQGQQTTLVVQMFGSSYKGIASAPKTEVGGQALVVQNNEHSPEPQVLAGAQNFPQKPLFNPTELMKTLGVMLILMIASLTALDLIILKRRGVLRLSSHHIAHLSFLAVAGAALLLNIGGHIL